MPNYVRIVYKKLRHLTADVLLICGFKPKLNTVDRVILEKTILPHFSSLSHYKSVIFIGCDWYTKHYEDFFKGHIYWTIDNDTNKIKYGAKFHICAGIESLGLYFENNAVDLIICNGVLGWGLDQMENIEHAFSALYRCIKPGGALILGWNDVSERRPLRPEDIKNLSQFKSLIIPGIHSPRYLTNTKTRHTYDFYTK